jgi:carbamoyltransferase
MNIIGYSGLHHSIAFKQKEFPGLSPREYRISQGLDAAAALVTPAGIQAAAAEERFTGVKGTNTFPTQAIEYCLRAGRLTPAQIDYVAHGFSYEPVKAAFQHTDFAQKQFDEVYAKQNQLALLAGFLPDFPWADKLVEVPHHLAHAASAYYVSGFAPALIVVTDGMGEIHSTTIAVGQGREIEILKTVTAPHSLGILYGVVTLYLGFWMGFDEYKVMGLDPYGNPRRIFNQYMEMIHLHPDGTFSTPCFFSETPPPWKKRPTAAPLQLLEEAFGPRRQPEAEITPTTWTLPPGCKPLCKPLSCIPCATFSRKPACAVSAWPEAWPSTAPPMASSSAAACLMICLSSLPPRMMVRLWAAALYVQHMHAAPPPRPKWDASVGPEYSAGEIALAIAARPTLESIHVPDFAALAADIARRLAAGQVVPGFRGVWSTAPRSG